MASRPLTLSRADVAAAIVQQLGCSVAAAHDHLKATIAIVSAAVAAGQRVELRGFAVFERRKRKGGVRQNVAARNPRIIAERAARKLPPLPPTMTVGPKWVAVARCSIKMPAMSPSPSPKKAA